MSAVLKLEQIVFATLALASQPTNDTGDKRLLHKKMRFNIK